MRLIFLDSCVVIYLHEAAASIQDEIRARMGGAGEAEFRFTDLTRLECRVRPLRTQDQTLLTVYERFFGLAELAKVPLTAEVFDLAAKLRADHRLKTPDALHLAAALLSGCDELWTNDGPLSKVDVPLQLKVVP